MSKCLLFLPAVLVAAAFPLVGCGGGSDTGTSSGSDQAQISDVINTAATTTSHRNCTVLETQRFVDQNSNQSGAAALKDCETTQPGETDADSVDVSNIQISGDTATADAAITGSVFDGQTISLSLVKEGDQWKLDHVDSFVNYNAQALADSLSKGLQTQGQLTAAQITCVQKVVTTTPAAQVQDAILSGEQQQLSALFSSCNTG